MASIEARARAPLRFRFGLAVGIIIGVYAAALLVITFREPLVGVEPAKVSETSSIVVVPEATAMAPVQRLVPMAKEALNVNLGPGAAYGVLGTLPKGALIDVIPGERSSGWVAIRFPPNSSGRGWIPADGIEQVARDEEAAAGVAAARTDQVSEVMTTSDETAPDPETTAPLSTLGRRELAMLTAVSAAALALLMVAFVLRQRAARQQFVWVSDAPPVVIPKPAIARVTLPVESAGPGTTPEPLIEAKESAMNPEADQEMSQGKAGADEVLQRGLGEFSQMLQSLTTSVCSALERLSGDFRDAFSSLAEEQRAALQRQQALLEEAQRATNEAKGYAEQASLSASQSSSNQERAQELIANLQKDREGLTVLVGDLRSRIAALSILAAPLPETNQSQQEVVLPAGGEQRGEWSQ
jgi:uncharacterized protein YgiM (DUF1202 family)